ncbi:MAG: DUF1127 domain-containing protein [Rhodobacteraceae bacterium]|jgi:uncharacterized protein YjiS (DUF1127 family)|uniref:YjiS-like domain-containing protein n=1 Tax=Salipiger profundus TaxID=1229727 RepID=A0A1U7D281_9RHOB|nr:MULTISPECIES: DUF1127 domain-containing protein [Salipiger]APX22170.1 hypothetical protein Ga0080559_TMP1374 [Salipiger profundus]MAB05184.1 DUF1127 domain-containing protein [Paracoccaceae bacterium]GGA07982.1 hypothetical protein GCM10011326_19830 [Salipiger profundus]SFC47321.1 Uncharacterized conserved protein YjiS, DUF1127 family [Salipiger profundus]
MSAYDTIRPENGAAGLAGRIGNVFVSGFGAAPERGASASFVIASQISRFVSQVADGLIAWNETRLTRKSLQALTDRELEDIGLTRFQIEEVARGR